MHIRFDILEDDTGRLTFDREGSKANILDQTTMIELGEHLKAIASNQAIRGLVLLSAKKSIFIAGADINELSARDLPREGLRELIRSGQEIVNLLAELPVPTVAAIHGACLGGGYELCLACDYRIATEERSTIIGLPETMLGMIPGWGGCARLPRLIGLAPALDVITHGRRLPATEALAHGMVDALVEREEFVSRACSLIDEGVPHREQHATPDASITEAVVQSSRDQLARDPGGVNPAATRAVDVIAEGISSMQKALACELDALVELVPSENCQRRIKEFFRKEAARRRTKRETTGEDPVQAT